MNKVFFIDIDGTILDGSRGMKDVSEKTRYALKQLSQQDYVIISSGRCMGLLDRQIKELDHNGYILCNGAYGEVDGKPVYGEYFDRDAVDRIISVSSRNEGFCILETLNEMYVDSLDSAAFKVFMEGWGTALKGFEEGDLREGRYHIAMIGFLKEEQFIAAEEQLADCVDLARHHGSLSYDVNIKGISKGTGVRRILSYLGIPIKNSYAFGDAVNDLEMLEAVGNPVLMANCDSKLLSKGFAMTDDVLDDGLYNYLIAQKLIKPM